MPLQDHIHLDTIQSSGAPENAPAKKWHVLRRTAIPNIIMSAERSLVGKLYLDVLQNENGVVDLMDYEYILRLRSEGIYSAADFADQIRRMYGRTVYLVDNLHPDDGENHAASIKRMRLTEVGEISDEYAMLQYIDLKIYLTDDSL